MHDVLNYFEKQRCVNDFPRQDIPAEDAARGSRLPPTNGCGGINIFIIIPPISDSHLEPRECARYKRYKLLKSVSDRTEAEHRVYVSMYTRAPLVCILETSYIVKHVPVRALGLVDL